jgi:hypothetical protein
LDTEILSWAASSFASGALSAGGGMAFNYLVAYIGIEQPDTKILNQLSEISNQLKELARGISEINQRVIDLSKQLAISTLEIEKIMEETNLRSALSSIRTHVGVVTPTPAQLKGKATDDIPLTSLAEILNGIKNNEPPTAERQKAFFKNVLVTWDILKAVHEINLGLLGSDLNGGILSLATRLSIAKMGSGEWDPNLFSHYEALEARFLSLLSIQMQGVFLVTAAKNYGSPAEAVSAEAARYLWEDYAPTVLAPQLDRFLWCAEKLALSQGQWRSPWPAPGSSTYTDQQGRVRLKGGLGAPPELAKILLRSELVARRFREIFRDMRNYKPKFPERRPAKELTDLVRTRGIYVHRLCRESEITERDKGPELQPWPGYESRGRALPATSAVIPQWDGAKDGFARLMKPEQSAMRVVRYFWPDVESSLKDPERSFASALSRAKPYSEAEVATNLGLNWKGIGSLTQYLDLKSLCVVPQIQPASSAAWTVSPVTFEKGHNSGKLTSHYLDTPLMAPVLSRPDERAQFSLEGTKISGRGDAMSVNCRLESPIFRYEGIQPQLVTLHLWMTVDNYRKGYRDKFLHIGGRLIVKLKKPSGEQQIYDSETVPNFSLWDWNGAGGEARSSDEPRLSIPFKVGETGQPEQYSLLVHLQVGHTGLGRDVMAMISGLIRECSLRWTPAAPAPAARRAKAQSPKSKPKALKSKSQPVKAKSKTLKSKAKPLKATTKPRKTNLPKPVAKRTETAARRRVKPARKVASKR